MTKPKSDFWKIVIGVSIIIGTQAGVVFLFALHMA